MTQHVEDKKIKRIPQGNGDGDQTHDQLDV